MPGRRGQGPEKLPSGQELKAAYFIFDGAPDLVTSRRWAKAQRPYIGDIKMGAYSPVPGRPGSDGDHFV